MIRIATRTSELALTQAGAVAEAIGDAELVGVKASGDEGMPGAGGGDKARFVREIDAAVLAGDAEFAVHSAKDVPGELEDGLEIVAVPGREDPADALVGGPGSVAEIAEGARVGTASLRRRSQLLALRPDLEVVELRGNVDTRLRKVEGGEVDCAVLALAGLRRLGREAEVSYVFAAEEMTPAPGQGALALVARRGDGAGGVAVEVADQAALAELTAERAAVAALGASCDTPVGILARLSGVELTLSGYAGLPDGSEWVRDELTADATDPAAAGRELAERMIAAGAADILARAEALA